MNKLISSEELLGLKVSLSKHEQRERRLKKTENNVMKLELPWRPGGACRRPLAHRRS